jgi:hypothetical protein
MTRIETRAEAQAFIDTPKTCPECGGVAIMVEYKFGGVRHGKGFDTRVDAKFRCVADDMQGAIKASKLRRPFGGCDHLHTRTVYVPYKAGFQV